MQYKAARTTASSLQGLDETALLMMSCRHGIVFRELNLFRGETYRHVLYLHEIACSLKSSFFCYDVICQYWPFLKDVASKIERFLVKTTKTTLPRPCTLIMKNGKLRMTKSFVLKSEETVINYQFGCMLICEWSNANKHISETALFMLLYYCMRLHIDFYSRVSQTGRKKINRNCIILWFVYY